MARRNTVATSPQTMPTTPPLADERAGALFGRTNAVGPVSARGRRLSTRPLRILEVYQ